MSDEEHLQKAQNDLQAVSSSLKQPQYVFVPFGGEGGNEDPPLLHFALRLASICQGQRRPVECHHGHAEGFVGVMGIPCCDVFFVAKVVVALQGNSEANTRNQRNNKHGAL